MYFCRLVISSVTFVIGNVMLYVVLSAVSNWRYVIWKFLRIPATCHSGIGSQLSTMDVELELKPWNVVGATWGAKNTSVSSRLGNRELKNIRNWTAGANNGGKAVREGIKPEFHYNLRSGISIAVVRTPTAQAHGSEDAYNTCLCLCLCQVRTCRC